MQTERPPYFPVFLDLRGKRCVVVGAGKVGFRKAEGLLEAGAKVCVLSPEAVEGIKALASAGHLEWREREYREGDLQGAFLVIGAAGERTVNARVFREAEAAGTLVNIVDDPEYCNFIVASLLRRGDFQVAVSTGGASPVLARQARKLLERVFPEHFTQVVAELQSLRERVKADVPDEGKRRRFWEEFVDLDYFAGLKDKDIPAELRKRAERCLSRLED